MTQSIPLGVDLDDSRRPVGIHPDIFQTHFHLIGATGSGKTNAVQTMLRPLMKEPRNKCALFVIDPMGGLSRDLLLWISSPHCPEHVRKRLLYIEPANEDVVLPFNPLTFTSEARRYYQVARSVDLILRAWSAQNVGEQPRLMQWAYRAMCSMAVMNFPISMSRYLLHPGGEEHHALLQKLPEAVRWHWQEILNAKGPATTQILESTRNRFDPFFESVVLRRMFGVVDGRLDVERCIRERRIVIVNVAKHGVIPVKLGSTLGSLILNEILETASNMAGRYGRQSVDPTYVLLDEFQRFADSPDVEDALPTVRQLGLRLILAHQSFSQLDRGDVDLTQMIWQARSRLMFANSSDDADIIANELAIQTFDPHEIKHQLFSRKQRVTGYRREWLESESVSHSHSEGQSSQDAVGYSTMGGDTREESGQLVSRREMSGNSRNSGSGSSQASGRSSSQSRSESLVPIHEEFDEESSRTFRSFDEHRLEWMRKIRQLQTGEAFGKFVGDRKLHHLQIHHSQTQETKRRTERLEQLLARNFEQDFFISAAEADRLAERDRQLLLAPDRIVLDLQKDDVKPPENPGNNPPDEEPFR